MEFESLKHFFGNELSIKIRTDHKISFKYIKIHSLENYITFSGLDKNDTDSYEKGIISQNDSVKLRSAIDKSHDYFAKVIDSTDKDFTISIIHFNNIPLNDDISIGIGDIGSSFSKAVNHINNDFVLDVCGKKYYIYGLHKNAGLNIFSIMCPSTKFDVILSRREECGAVADKEIANEQIWAIRSKESRYRKDDYNFQLRKVNFAFKDVSSVKAATEQNKLEMKAFDESSILGRWMKFAEEDYKKSQEKIDSIGLLKYGAYQHLDGNRHVFTITSETKKIELLRSSRSELGSDLSFIVYDNIDEAGAVKVRRQLACPKLIEMTGNKIICSYDGDVIIREEGYLRISNYGARTVYERRLDAANRIKGDRAAKPNIMQLIDGKSIYSASNKRVYRIEDYMKEIKAAFGGRMPNQSQLDAIEVAINTPDFAIIQGPPGCGKTSLINAIDDCLAKIDSTFHKRAGSLSTAYQRESTKNMVAKKCINGVPVPFVSKSSRQERLYIEKQFTDYIDDIAKKLQEKYPELTEEINDKSDLNTLTSYVSRFNWETATFESLIYFIDNVHECLKGELPDLIEIKKQAQKGLKRILEPNKDECLYYIRNIPSSSVSFEDDGLKTFLQSKLNLKILRPKLSQYLDLIEQYYHQETINFTAIAAIKNEMIFTIKNEKKLDKNVELNKKASQIVYEVKEKIEEVSTHDNNYLLTQYINSFINDPVRVRQALEQWITSVAATHQISSDSNAIGQALDDDDSLVVYDNVLIDEAARSCPPDLLIPISCAKNRIIMVGDHKQLPQFVNDEVLENLDLDASVKHDMKNVSMFEYLIETTKKLAMRDSFVRFVALNQQYRMPKVLGDFIGDNFYSEIKLGSPRGNPCDDENFIQTLPYVKNKCMVWCDVPYGKEYKVNDRGHKNVEEAIVVSKLLNKFLNDEENSKLTIGVISFYKDQVREIKDQLTKFNIYVRDDSGIKINNTYKDRLQVDTVDAFQGLECDIIILSMVRSNPYKKFKPGSFGFLRDERHLCVALSRQKRCLIVVGNGSGMLETENAKSSVKALANYYERCKKGGEYVEFIESKDII